MIVKVKCGWCQKEFETENAIGKFGYAVKVCSNCGRIVRSSVKEPTGILSKAKHIHRPLKTGDVV